MKINQYFITKKLLLVNLVLAGILIGFITGIFTINKTDNSSITKVVHAQENEINIPQTVIDLQSAFRMVSKKTLPVVVEITVVEIKKQTIPDGNAFPWHFFFSVPEDDNGNDPKEKEFRNQGLGSGVIIRKEKGKIYVLTNNHVVGDASEINVILYDERTYTAKLVGRDERKDLALIYFESDENDIPVADIGDSDTLEIGDWVIAVGNPFGFVSSVTAGIVSAKGRRGPRDNISDFIQTDAAINQGNSGGALVNLKGELIGINTWITTPTGGNIGLGFAIPINNAKKAIDDFINTGSVKYGWLGVSISDVSEDMAREMNIQNKKGAIISHVFMESPADKAGILSGDFVVEINNKKIENSNQLVMAVGDLPPDKKANFKLYRNGKMMSVDVKIGLRKDKDAIADLNKKLWPGINVVTLNDEIKKELKLKDEQNGVIIINVENKTLPHIAGLKSGDIITQINGKEIKNMLDFYNTINDKNNKEINIKYIREGVELNVGIKK